MNYLKLLSFALLFSIIWASPSLSKTENETVVLLHGIAKTNKSMKPVETHLQKLGFKTANITYPSQKKSLEEISKYLRKNHLNQDFWRNSNKVHIVTHSMGGLVARKYLSNFKKDIPKNKMGRVVMLAPPNQGSTIADTINKLLPYKWYYGPAGQELTTHNQSQTNDTIDYDLGIIAGKKEWPYFVAKFFIKGRSDGRVSIDQTKLDGMKDHVVVNGTHTFIMKRTDVHALVSRFLKTGTFSDKKN